MVLNPTRTSTDWIKLKPRVKNQTQIKSFLDHQQGLLDLQMSKIKWWLFHLLTIPTRTLVKNQAEPKVKETTPSNKMTSNKKSFKETNRFNKITKWWKIKTSSMKGDRFPWDKIINLSDNLYIKMMALFNQLNNCKNSYRISAINNRCIFQGLVSALVHSRGFKMIFKMKIMLWRKTMLENTMIIIISIMNVER